MRRPQTRETAPFIEDVLASLKKRSKALKHKNSAPQIERFLESEGDLTRERVEILIAKPRSMQRLQVTIWSDRMVEAQACEPGQYKGWKFTYDIYGRVVGDVGGRELVAAIEASLSAMFEITQANTSKLERIWSPLLAQGPKAV